MSDEEGRSEFLWPSPKYSSFTQAVRRFRPSQLVPLLASMTVRDDPNYHGFEDVRVLPPWSTMAIARESIVRGNEFRSAVAAPDDVQRLARLHHQTFVEPERDILTAVIGPLMWEQFYWQISLYEEQMRAVSWFDDPGFGPQFDWSEIFGMSLPAAVQAIFFVGLAVNKTAGRWDPEMISRFYREDPRLEEHTPLDDVLQMAINLTTTIDAIRDEGRDYDNRADLDRSLAKHPLNPLFAHPLIDLGGNGIWAPVAPLVWRAALPNVLYVMGRARWGSAFPAQLGQRFERYVGALLRNVAPDLFGEVAFGKGGGQKSVDWIWVGETAVVLIECKSAGLSIDSLAGGGNFNDVVARSILKGRQQIDRTASAIRSKTKGFEVIPLDRPIYGLVVTSEPFFMANAGLEEFGSRSETPSLVATVRAIEHLTSHPDALDHLIAVFEDDERKRWDLQQAIKNLPTVRHPISERAWLRVTGRTLPPS